MKIFRTDHRIRYCIKRPLGCFFLFHLIISANAQINSLYTQYFSSQLVINPAYAGMDEALSLTLIHKEQWVGVEGAPATTVLTAHTLFKNMNTGLGLNIAHDQINIHKQTTISGIYSYRIRLGAGRFVNLGLQSGLKLFRSDYASLQPPGAGDPTIPGNNLRYTHFQVGTGIYYKSKRFEAGASLPVLYSANISGEINLSESPNDISGLFLYTRYHIPVSSGFSLYPSVLFRYNSHLPVSYDLNIEARLKEFLILALSYRNDRSISNIVQFMLLPQLKLGYAYDFAFWIKQGQGFQFT
jgi:type IX secretion system PorP/SprF family membrane protein